VLHVEATRLEFREDPPALRVRVAIVVHLISLPDW
jgi:hypothetical protein